MVLPWIEKRALHSLVRGVADEWRLPSGSGGGFDSWPLIYDVAQSLSNYEEVVVLFAGDFDPSGEEIGESLVKRLNEIREYVDFPVPEFRLRRIALTPDQIRTYDLPRNLLKTSDPRTGKHRLKYGKAAEHATELDALPPNVLEDIFREAIEEEVDQDHFEEAVAREAKERAEVGAALDRVKRSFKRRSHD
jgi:hypothetical protein